MCEKKTNKSVEYFIFEKVDFLLFNSLICIPCVCLSRYKVDNISSEKAFLLSVNFSACFESNGDCMLNFPIMVNTKIPVLDCDFKNQSFAIPGSLNDLTFLR